MRRLLAAAGLIALLLVPVLARPASAHPLGNYTVNRAVAVTIAADHVALLYLVDMAEIPTFNEITAIDTDADGSVAPAEANDVRRRGLRARPGQPGAARRTARPSAWPWRASPS